MDLQPQLKTVLHPYTRIAWINPATSLQMSVIYDRYQNDALEELEDQLRLANIEYEKDTLTPC